MTQPWTDADVELVAKTFVAEAKKNPVEPAHYYLWGGTSRLLMGPNEFDIARAALSALAAAGRLTSADTDEHGNRADNCGVCTLVPSVNGWTRMTQSGCPVHGPYTWASPVTATGFDTEEDTRG